MELLEMILVFGVGYVLTGYTRLWWQVRRRNRLADARHAELTGKINELHRQLQAHAGCWACQDDDRHHAPGDAR